MRLLLAPSHYHGSDQKTAGGSYGAQLAECQSQCRLRQQIYVNVLINAPDSVNGPNR